MNEVACGCAVLRAAGCWAFALHAVMLSAPTLHHGCVKKGAELPCAVLWAVRLSITHSSCTQPGGNACLQLMGTATRWLSGLSSACCDLRSCNSGGSDPSCFPRCRQALCHRASCLPSSSKPQPCRCWPLASWQSPAECTGLEAGSAAFPPGGTEAPRLQGCCGVAPGKAIARCLFAQSSCLKAISFLFELPSAVPGGAAGTVSQPPPGLCSLGPLGAATSWGTSPSFSFLPPSPGGLGCTTSLLTAVSSADALLSQCHVGASAMC